MSPVLKDLRRQTHQTLAKVTDDIGRRQVFNTAIAAVMELLNAINKLEDNSELARAVRHEALMSSVLMLSPMMPHICHRLWQELGQDGAIIDAPWPPVDETALVQDSIEMVVQVNGKLRDKLSVPANAAKDEIEQLARTSDKVEKHIAGKQVRKVIVVPGKLINIVVG